jgi:glutathione peroxidase
MKALFYSFLIFTLMSNNNSTFHQFKIESITGDQIDFSAYKGKKILIVNVASKCGYTPQYKELQELYTNFGDKLVVIGFPCNDFGGQESGSNEEIQSFCDSKYGVTFPMTTKVKIKGKDAHPIYQWLTTKDKNGVMDADVRWNFHKFLIDEQGNLVKAYPSSVKPLSEEILGWVKS